MPTHLHNDDALSDTSVYRTHDTRYGLSELYDASVDDAEAALRACATALRPGALLVVADPMSLSLDGSKPTWARRALTPYVVT